MEIKMLKIYNGKSGIYPVSVEDSEIDEHVGGRAEFFPATDDGIVFVHNDSASAKPSILLAGENGRLIDSVRGNVLIARRDAEGRLRELTPADVERLTNWYHSPESFVWLEDPLRPVPNWNVETGKIGVSK